MVAKIHGCVVRSPTTSNSGVHRRSEVFARFSRSQSRVRTNHQTNRRHDTVSADWPVIVMEFVDGRTLRAVIAKVSLRRSHSWCSNGESLSAAHADGITHREISQTLMVRDDVSEALEFGLARLPDHSSDTEDMTLAPTTTPGTVGDACYSLLNKRVVRQWISFDVFALGMFL